MSEKNTDLPEKRRSYSPAETAEVRFQAVNQIVSAQARMLEKTPEKTNLNDLAAVQRVAVACMEECSNLGLLPNFETLAAALGYSRRGLYDYLERHGDTETASYLDRLRTAWASMRQMAADRGAVSETMSIFVLLNSSLGFTNQHSVEITQPKSPLDPPDAETAAAIRQKYIDALPEEDE